MKKIIALFTVLILIFTLASCGSSKKDELESQYYEIAQNYIKKGENEKALDAINEGLEKFPESILLNSLLDSVNEEGNSAPETTKAPVAVTEDGIINDFKELRKLYFKWFHDFTFAADKSQIVYLEDYSAQYPVAESGVDTYDDFKKLFTKYCDDALFNSYSSKSFVTYKDINGKLHAIEPEIMEIQECYDKDFRVSKVSETEYKLVYNEFHNNYGDVYYYKVTLDYKIDINGEWKFCNEKKENMGYIDEIPDDDLYDDGINSNNGGNNNFNAGEIIDDVNDLVGDTIDNVGGLLNKYF